MLTFEEWRHTYADVFETDDAARAAWTAACNRGYRTGMQDTRELLAAHSVGAQRVTNIPERQRGESFRDWAKRTYELQDAQPMPQTDSAGAQEPVGYVSKGWADTRIGLTTIYPNPRPRLATLPVYVHPQPIPQTDSAGARASSGSLAFDYGNALVDKKLDPSYNAHPQPMPQTDAARDAKRLDWLCEHVVNVRMPLVYGSKDMFWASPVDDDSGHAPSDLRARIDSEIERLDRAKGE